MDFYDELCEPDLYNEWQKKQQRRRIHKKQRGVIDDLSYFMKIRSIESSSSATRKTYQEVMNVEFKHLKRAFNPVELLHEMFGALLERINGGGMKHGGSRGDYSPCWNLGNL